MTATATRPKPQPTQAAIDRLQHELDLLKRENAELGTVIDRLTGRDT